MVLPRVNMDPRRYFSEDGSRRCYQFDRAQYLITQNFRIVPLIALACLFIPRVFSAAELTDVIVPCKVFHSVHDFAVVFQVVVGRMEKDEIIACGKLSKLKAIGDFSIVACGNAHAVKVAAFAVNRMPACSMTRNDRVADIA